MDVFINYLKNNTSLREKEIGQIRLAATALPFHRKNTLLRAGEFCLGYAFITKGCFRIFRPTEDGKELTFRFGIENWWVSDMESIDLRQPSRNTIEALENSEVLFWT